MAGDPKFDGVAGPARLPLRRLRRVARPRRDPRRQPRRRSAAAWDEALAADRPFVIEAVTDPNVPPLPPHISLEQAKAFTSSLLKGDAEALGFLKQTFKDVTASLAPRKK